MPLKEAFQLSLFLLLKYQIKANEMQDQIEFKQWKTVINNLFIMEVDSGSPGCACTPRT